MNHFSPAATSAPAADKANVSTPEEAKRTILDRFKGKGNILTPRAKKEAATP